MRCPYCGGVNTERATFCTYCGRDLIPPKPNQQLPRQQPPQPTQPPYQQPRQVPPQPPNQPYPQPVRPPQTPYSAPGRPAPASMPQQPVRTSQAIPATHSAAVTRIVQSQPQLQPQPRTPVAPPAPDPPAPFPPRSPEQLHALESGALTYNVIESAAQYGRKKIVNIVYPRCSAWQQVATLLKALKEQQETQFDTIVVLGYWRQDPDMIATSTFTNGHLVFDRNVRLGSQIQNRYQIDTGNGFDNNAIRIVLSE
jgi:hypothetical protein